MLPLAAKFSNGNDRYFGEIKSNSQLNLSSSKQRAVPQSAPIISANNLKSLFNFSKSQIPPVDGHKGASETFHPKYAQSSFDLHKAHFMETYTQPYTKEALLSLTQPRDDPPPYTAEIERELVQHLEFIQSPNAMVASSEKLIDKLPLYSEPANEMKEREIMLQKLSPPSYEETQSQIEGVSSTLSLLIEKNNWNTHANVSEPELAKFSPSEILESPPPHFLHLDSTASPVKCAEFVVPLSTTSIEVASQTEEANLDKFEPKLVANESKISQTTFARRVSPEEIDCETLSKDLVSQLSPSDKLHQLLGNENRPFTI